MSSFLCNPETIALAASAVNLQEPPELRRTFHDESNAAAELAALNIRGFSARYGSQVSDEIEGYLSEIDGQAFPSNTDRLFAYKALRCVLYQAAEGDTPDSEEYKRWSAISDRLAHQITSDAADAAGAPWG